MKKFTGQVTTADENAIYLRKQHTHVTIYYENNDAPKVKVGDTVEVKSDKPFPITVSNENAYGIFGGPTRARRVRGRYYLHNTEIKSLEVIQ